MLRAGRGISVGIMTMLRAGHSAIPLPVGAKDFTNLQSVQTGSGAHSASLGWETRNKEQEESEMSICA
jgi:hypothetical protein